MPAARSRLRTVLRGVLAVTMIGVGVSHFVMPDPFVRMMPAMLPAPLALVRVSGFFEVLGGAGLLVPRVRRAAALGLVALYLAVFPANINMAVNHISLDGLTAVSPLLLWLRLPMQAVLIAWALWVRHDGPARPADALVPPRPVA
jgi:uncharacterized membrane protein